MSNDYDASLQPIPQPDANSTTSGGGARYIGPRIRNRSTGEVRYWVQGQGYVGANDLRRLPALEQRQVNEARQRSNLMVQSLPDWHRFEELNTRENTGSYGQIAGNVLHIPPVLGRPDEDEMRSIIAKWVPNQRTPGAGTTSDRDLSFYEGALPSTSRVGPSNSRIIRDFERNSRIATAYADFLDWYWPRTGSLNGAQAQWAQYLQRNPNLETNWRQYFENPQQTPPVERRPESRSSQQGPAPDGVTQSEWDHMTPQERALWQN